ncbi:uncharacterized protein LOC129789546 [Lutzomyia longipalpis]|uniref:uncharacterized protein LOC129789546 n=1 Tax=Lutzomyia longipalpis TaxID=7200 RepID=UPI002483F42C|nr:uncharacterized protein LOC129789546 [Lutzomyia longipalpis]
MFISAHSSRLFTIRERFFLMSNSCPVAATWMHSEDALEFLMGGPTSLLCPLSRFFNIWDVVPMYRFWQSLQGILYTTSHLLSIGTGSFTWEKNSATFRGGLNATLIPVARMIFR